MKETALFVCGLESAQVSPMIGRLVEPGEVMLLPVDDVETTVPGKPPEAFGESLPEELRAKLADAAITPAKALEVGEKELAKIEGVGGATAKKIVKAATTKGTKVSVPWLKRATQKQVQAWCGQLRRRAKELKDESLVVLAARLEAEAE